MTAPENAQPLTLLPEGYALMYVPRDPAARPLQAHHGDAVITRRGVMLAKIATLDGANPLHPLTPAGVVKCHLPSCPPLASAALPVHIICCARQWIRDNFPNYNK